MQHELKIWNESFDALLRGKKTAELRKDDRGFDLGDTLLLREYRPVSASYTGRAALFEITHIMNQEVFGLKTGYVMLSLRPIPSQIAPESAEKPAD